MSVLVKKVMLATILLAWLPICNVWGQTGKGKDKVLEETEVMPSFPGGNAALATWLGENVKYPPLAENNGVEGRVVVRFVVEHDGSIRDSEVIKSVDPLLDKEALRVINAMPLWIPGKQKGKPVAVHFTLPITFKLEDQSTPQTGNNKAGDKEKPLDKAEVMPSFPGGTAELMKWLGNNIKYPAIAQKHGVQGRVIVRFAVDKDGSIRDSEVIRSIDPSLDKEALRVVNAMPRWIPGKQDGKPVAVYFTLPITYHL